MVTAPVSTASTTFGVFVRARHAVARWVARNEAGRLNRVGQEGLVSLTPSPTLKIVVGISGASGVIYGIRALQLLKEIDNVETHLVITDMGKATIGMETDHSISDVESLADRHYGIRDLAAGISSGSFETDGMIVAPCSVRSLSSIAHCSNDNLLARAADVTLKQRRRLVLLFRETPLHEGHCKLMLDASRLGAILMPPLPAFYTRPRTIEEMVDQTIGRVLDFWRIDVGAPRWDGYGEPASRRR
jgi:4-hydroxy-3-polyprenylbenzoate decarboxylase